MPSAPATRAPSSSKREDHPAQAVVKKPSSAGPGLFHISNRHTAERFRLGFVGDHVIRLAGFAQIQRLRGCWIENRADPVPAGNAQRVIHSLDWDFQLEHDEVRAAEQAGCGIHIGRSQTIVGALHH